MAWNLPDYNQLGTILQNPNVIAGIARFNPGGEQPLLQAAFLQRQQEEAKRQQEVQDMAKQAALREQQVAQALPQILGTLDPKNPQEALNKLGQIGVPPKDALVMIKHLQELTAEHLEDKFNPVTGELVRFQDKLAQGSAPQQGVGYSSTATIGQQLGGGLGEPVVKNPFANTPVGQKQAYEEELAEKKESKKATKDFLKETSQTAVGESKFINKLDSATKLIDKFYQGTGAGLAKSINRLSDPQAAKSAEAFESIVSKLSIDLSANLKGAQSDKDMERIELTKPSLSNTKEGNKAIIRELKAVANREIEYNRAGQEFVKHGGTPEQFKTRWSEYTRAFPLINDDGTVNQTNQTLWKDIIFRPDSEFDAIIASSTPVEETPAETIRSPFGEYSIEELEALE